MNLIDVTKKFADEEACVKHLAAMRWPDGVRCLKCDSDKVTFMATKSKPNRHGIQKTRYIYQCRACKYQFTPMTGTLFNDTHLDLEKWYMAIALMCNAKKSLSALQMKRDLNVAYKTAWYLNHRIREAMNLFEHATATPLTGTIEADETYVGAKKYDKRRKRAKYDKEPVFGMVERDGKVRTWHVPTVNRHHVIDKLKDNVSIEADAVYTELLQWRGALYAPSHQARFHASICCRIDRYPLLR
jgi:transposase-like protein